jgi:hypothetical protein
VGRKKGEKRERKRGLFRGELDAGKGQSCAVIKTENCNMLPVV